MHLYGGMDERGLKIIDVFACHHDPAGTRAAKKRFVRQAYRSRPQAAQTLEEKNRRMSTVMEKATAASGSRRRPAPVSAGAVETIRPS